MVYLSTKNLALPKGWARKLLPRYIGPYKVVEAHTAASTATLELPPELVSMLRVAQATRVLQKSRPEVRKFGGFLELASVCVLRLPSVTSRVFRTEVRIEFPERAGMEKCTRMVPSTSTKM